MRQVANSQKKIVVETQTAIGLMEQVCKEWSIKDDLLNQRVKSIQQRFQSVINAERTIFNNKQIDKQEDDGLNRFLHCQSEPEEAFEVEDDQI